MGKDKQIDDANKIIRKFIFVIDKKAKQGCIEKSWIGIQNGNGVEIGKDIETLIIKSQKYINKYLK